jgi:dihydroneopterin aldolase
MSDRILIEDLRLECVIGVGEEERRAPQELRLSIELELELRSACASDAIEDTVHYGDLARAIQALAVKTSDRLLERLAQRIAELCLEDPRVEAAHITLVKPGAIAAAEGAGVRLHRCREQGEARTE